MAKTTAYSLSKWRLLWMSSLCVTLVSAAYDMKDLDCTKAKSGFVPSFPQLWYKCVPETCKFECEGKKTADFTCDPNGQWRNPSLPTGCSVKAWDELIAPLDCRLASDNIPIAPSSKKVKFSDCKLACRLECKSNNETLPQGPHNLGKCTGNKWANSNVPDDCKTVADVIAGDATGNRGKIWSDVDCTNTKEIVSSNAAHQELLRIFSYTHEPGYVICKHEQRDHHSESMPKAPTANVNMTELIRRNSRTAQGRKGSFKLKPFAFMGECDSDTKRWSNANDGPQVCRYPRQSVQDHSFPWVLMSLAVFLLLGIAVQSLIRVLHIPIPYTVFLLFIGMVLGAIFYGLYTTREIKLNKAGMVDFEDGWTTTIVRWKDFTWSCAKEMSPYDILQIFLPILIFESAFGMPIDMFVRSIGSILLVAMPGIVIATLLTALLIWQIPWFEMDFEVALALGATVSATDPVAVVSILSESGAPKYLAVLIEGESLLNDGAAIFLFEMFAEYKGQVEEPFGSGKYKYEAKAVALFLLQVAILATVWGLVCGWLLEQIVYRIIDPLAEVTLVISSAYIAYFAAETWLHCSGVLTVVSMGLYMGHAKTAISLETEHFMHEFMSLLSWLANTLLFIVSGIIIFDTMTTITEARSGRIYPWWYDITNIFVLYVLITVVRAFLLAFFWILLAKMPGYGFNYRTYIVLLHGALRGAVGLALGLVMVNQMTLHPGVNRQGQTIMILLSGIVIITLMFNAVTVTPILNRLGFMRVNALKLQLIDRVVEDVVDTMNVATKQLKREPAYGNVDWDRLEYMIELTNPYDEEKIKNEKKIKKVEKKERKVLDKLEKARLKRGGEGEEEEPGNGNVNENRGTTRRDEDEEDSSSDDKRRRRAAGRRIPSSGNRNVNKEEGESGRGAEWTAIPLCSILSKGPNARTVVAVDLVPPTSSSLSSPEEKRERGGAGGRGGGRSSALAKTKTKSIDAVTLDDGRYLNDNNNNDDNGVDPAEDNDGARSNVNYNHNKRPTLGRNQMKLSAMSRMAMPRTTVTRDATEANVNEEDSMTDADDADAAHVAKGVSEMARAAEEEDAVRTRILKAQKISFRNQYEHGLISPTAATYLSDLVDFVGYKKRFLEVKDIEKHWQIRKSLLNMIRCFESMIKCTGSAEEIPAPTRRCRRRVYDVANRLSFDITFNILIILSMIPIVLSLDKVRPKEWNVQVDDGVTAWKPKVLLAFVVINYVFMAIFFIEFVLRLTAFGCHYFSSIWGVIDCLALWLMAIDAAIQTPKLFREHKADHSAGQTVQKVVTAFRFIRLVRLFRLIKPLIIWIRNRLVSRVNSNLLMGYDIGRAYIAAIDSFQKNIGFMTANSMELATRLEERFEKDRIEVAHALSNIQENHPGIGVAIKTRHAAQILVHKAEEQVRDLKHRGLIDDNEENSFKANIARIRKAIRKIPPRLPLIEPQQIIRQIKWLRGDEEAQDFFVINAELKKFAAGSKLMTPNRKYKGILIVTSGTIKVIGGGAFKHVAGAGDLNFNASASALRVNKGGGGGSGQRADQSVRPRTSIPSKISVRQGAGQDQDGMQSKNRQWLQYLYAQDGPRQSLVQSLPQNVNMGREGGADEEMEERRRFTGKEDFRAAGFIVNLDCALEKSAETSTAATCDTAVTAAFIPARALEEAMEYFSKRFLNLFYRMWVVYGSRMSEYILHGLYDYNTEELKIKLERGYILTVLKDRTDKFIIDHEADHVILIQGKAVPETSTKGASTKGAANAEPLIAPVEIPKYVIRLRFDFSDPKRDPMLFVVPKSGGRTIVELGPEHFGVTEEDDNDDEEMANLNRNINKVKEKDREGGALMRKGSSRMARIKAMILNRVKRQRSPSSIPDEEESRFDGRSFNKSGPATDVAVKSGRLGATSKNDSKLTAANLQRRRSVKCRKHRLVMEELDLTPNLAARIVKATPSIDRLLNLKKGNKMMERMEAAGRVSHEKGLFETAVTALAYQYLIAKFSDEEICSDWIDKLHTAGSMARGLVKARSASRTSFMTSRSTRMLKTQRV